MIQSESLLIVGHPFLVSYLIYGHGELFRVCLCLLVAIKVFCGYVGLGVWTLQLVRRLGCHLVTSFHIGSVVLIGEVGSWVC